MSDMARDPERLLDRAIDEIRDARPGDAAERDALARIWGTIGREIEASAPAPADDRPLRDCSDYQALIPAYLRGGLTDAKALLVKDHVGECVPCRRALNEFRRAVRPGAVAATGARGRSRASRWAWRVAAAAVILIALVGLSIRTDVFSFQAGGLITIERLDGEAFRITEQGTVPVNVGDNIDFSDVSALRTGKDSNAVLRLADDSRVEMNERAELAVYDRSRPWSRGDGDAVIGLNRGSIIVEASPQGSGHLFVDAKDCEVAVTGTVFAVNTGMKGSRVSVIEGEVHVDRRGAKDVLHPGDQSTTTASLERVPIAQEIAWSPERERYMRLLAEFSQVAREIAEEVPGPGLRYSTELLDLAPADTAIFVGIPNFADTLGDSYELLEQKVAANELLNEWWQNQVVASGAADQLRQAMDRVRLFGDHVGDEIAVTLQVDGSGEVEPPLLIARLTHPGDFRAFLDSQLDSLSEVAGESPPVVVEDGDAPPTDADARVLHVWVHDGYVAVSPDVSRLQAFAATLAPDGRGAFDSSRFHGALSQIYRDGVEWLVGVDVHRLLGDKAADNDMLQRLGLTDLDNVIAERKTRGARADNRVVLSFDQPRQGLASWLAEPAPMGSLDFVSADAGIAAAFVMQEPTAVVDQLFDVLRSVDEEFDQHLAEFQTESGIDIREDVAAALGGEFAFALEKPVLPNPSWKLIVEVYDPQRLERTLEWAVSRLDAEIRDGGGKGLTLQTTASGGRDWYEIDSLDTGLSVHYTFVDGYVVAGSSRALLNRTLQLRASGVTLAGAPGFIELMPDNGAAHVSALVYQNLGAIAGSLPAHLTGMASSLAPEQADLLEQIGSKLGPSLTVAYGEPDRIVFVNSSEGGLLGRGLGAFLNLDNLLSMPEWLGRSAEDAHGGTGDGPGADTDDAAEPEDAGNRG